MNGTTPHTNGTTTKHTTTTAPDDDDPVVNAREFVHAALDDLDRLLGVVIGAIDDQAYVPNGTDVDRVRKVSSQIRSSLLAIDAELGALSDAPPNVAAPKSGPVPLKPGTEAYRNEELTMSLEEIAKAEEEMQLVLAQLALDAHGLMGIRGNETGYDTIMRHEREANRMAVNIAELFRHTVTIRELTSLFGKRAGDAA